MDRFLENLLRLTRAFRRALRRLGPNGWLAASLSLALFLSIAAFSFLLGLEYGLGLFLLAILLAGVLCGRFLNPQTYQPPILPPSPVQLSPTEIAEIGEWLVQVGAYLAWAAQVLEVSVKQQSDDTLLIQKLAEVHEAAQALCLEVEAVIQQGRQQTYRVTSEVCKGLANAVAKIEVTESARLSIAKRRRTRS